MKTIRDIFSTWYKWFINDRDVALVCIGGMLMFLYIAGNSYQK